MVALMRISEMRDAFLMLLVLGVLLLALGVDLAALVGWMRNDGGQDNDKTSCG
jgi:hypothetical protein